MCFCLASVASRSHLRPQSHTSVLTTIGTRECLSFFRIQAEPSLSGVLYNSSSPPRHRKRLPSLPNHVRAASAPDPNLVHPPSLDVDPGAAAVGDLGAVRLVRVPQGHLAVDNQMRGQPGVRVGRVV